MRFQSCIGSPSKNEHILEVRDAFQQDSPPFHRLIVSAHTLEIHVCHKYVQVRWFFIFHRLINEKRQYSDDWHPISQRCNSWGVQCKKKTILNMIWLIQPFRGWLMIAFITRKSNLVPLLVEDETRNAEWNGNRNLEWWRDFSQLVKIENIKFLGISRYRDKVELRFWLDKNSEVSCDTNSNWDFGLIWIWSWLKYPLQSGFHLQFNSTFRVSSFTKWAVWFCNDDVREFLCCLLSECSAEKSNKTRKKTPFVLNRPTKHQFLMRSCVQTDLNQANSKLSILGRCVHLLKNIRYMNGS